LDSFHAWLYQQASWPRGVFRRHADELAILE